MLARGTRARNRLDSPAREQLVSTGRMEASPQLRSVAQKLNAEQLAAMADGADPRTPKLAAALRAVLESSFSPDEREWFDRIEALRTRLNARADPIDLVDYGSGRHQGRSVEEAYEGIRTREAVGEVAARRSKRPPWTSTLFALASRTHARNALELGTAYGISAAYQAAAQAAGGGGRFTTIEGDAAQAAIARENLAELGLPVDVVEGRFQDVLADVSDRLAPLDYVFVDGHHERDATIAYFETLLPFLADGAIVVFDDVSWSDGMRDAWRTLGEHGRVAVALHLVALGVCVVRDVPVAREAYRLLVVAPD